MDGGGFSPKPAAFEPVARASARPGDIVVGPGTSMSLLARHLACAGAPVHQVEDLLDMFAAARGTRCIIIDAAALPREDLGLLRRALQQSGAALVAVADDPRHGLVRELCVQHGARWLPWPPTLDDIAQLAGGDSNAVRAMPPSSLDARVEDLLGRGSASSTNLPTPFDFHEESSTAATPHAERAPGAPADPLANDMELDAIEEILTRGRASPVPGLELPRPLEFQDEDQPTNAPAADEAARRPVPPPQVGAGNPHFAPGFPGTVRMPDSMPAELALGGDKPATGPAPAASTATPAMPAMPATGAPLPEGLGGPLALDSDAKLGPAPAWMRDQVADLADQTTRLDLSLTVLTDSLDGLADERKQDLETQVEQVRGETARLMGFARTLAFLATPPARGTQRFDIGEVLKVYVAGLARQGPDAPRLLYRSAGPVEVRSDRGLLGVVFDALLFVARECSSRGVVVRAQVLAPKDGRVAVEIEFPAGPLDGRTVEHIFTPYALRRVLPNLGPNALAAAQAIVVGQGGDLTLGFLDKGRALWRLELPVADA